MGFPHFAKCDCCPKANIVCDSPGPSCLGHTAIGLVRLEQEKCKTPQCAFRSDLCLNWGVTSGVTWGLTSGVTCSPLSLIGSLIPDLDSIQNIILLLILHSSLSQENQVSCDHFEPSHSSENIATKVYCGGRGGP